MPKKKRSKKPRAKKTSAKRRQVKAKTAKKKKIKKPAEPEVATKADHEALVVDSVAPDQLPLAERG